MNYQFIIRKMYAGITFHFEVEQVSQYSACDWQTLLWIVFISEDICRNENREVLITYLPGTNTDFYIANVLYALSS